MRHTLFRRKSPPRQKPGRSKHQPRGGDRYPTGASGPEAKLSSYLSRLLDAAALRSEG